MVCTEYFSHCTNSDSYCRFDMYIEMKNIKTNPHFAKWFVCVYFIFI